MLQFLKRLTLNFKLNAVLLLAFAILLMALVTVTNTGFTALLDQVSTEQLALEADTLQQHFVDIEVEVSNAAKLLSASPGLVEAIEAGDTTAVRTAILLQGESLALDDIDVINSEGKRLLTRSAPDIATVNEAENRLFGLGLIGADTTGLIAEEEAGGALLLVGIAPVKTTTGAVIGAVLAGRKIDEAFMETLNFARKNPSIAFIYASKVVAQSRSANEEVYEVDADQTFIEQALRGQVWISDDLIVDENNTPDALAYAPLRIGGEIQAVLAIRSEFETLLTFQGDLTTRNLVVVGTVSFVALLATVFFIRRSVTLPLTRLKATSELIAGGDLQRRALVGSQDEIGQLALSFNTMAGQIEQRLVETQTARERAERSEQVKAAFLASMSHELRTPLNAIINFTRFVVEGDTGPVNEQQKELLTEVVGSGKHLLNLINDVLDMSKIEAHSLNLFIEDGVDITAIINTAVTTGRALLGDKPVELITSVTENLPPIRADRQRILQILLNIVSNACKFTDAGQIKLRAYTVDDELVITVEDTGYGIAPEDQELVFEAFKQTSSGLREGGGTGLGMPIARSLTEAHGGRIWLESTAGQGTTFYVSLPIKAETLQPAIN